MTFVVNANFIGRFKTGDNIVYNLEVLNELYRAQSNSAHTSHLFRKPICILLAAISEALLYDLFFRMKHSSREGVQNVAAEVLAHEQAKTRDKMETLIAGARKHDVLKDPSGGIYDQLDELRAVRNRLHIQNADSKLEPNESNVFTKERQAQAELVVEHVVDLVAARHERPEKYHNYVGEFCFPWNRALISAQYVRNRFG